MHRLENHHKLALSLQLTESLAGPGTRLATAMQMHAVQCHSTILYTIVTTYIVD